MNYKFEWYTLFSLTWERDVEALEGDGKVWDEAKLCLEVAVQPGVDRRGSLWTGEPGEGPHKTAVLRQEQIVMVILQVKRMKRELHTWEEEASDELFTSTSCQKNDLESKETRC